jgi:serine/threonine-protein kinase
LLWEGPLPETSFGNYQLIELLGRGGMGEVWRAYDTVIDRTVAIKILPASISKDEVFQQRFRREAHAAARLNSPHIVPIHTHGEIDGRLFVDMRLIEGTDLQSIVNNGPLPPARAVRIVEQIARALHAAHKIGLLHRDVKPSNILIDDDDDYAYLIDFGIALQIGERGLTTVGDVIGTFHYMAPERFKPDEPDTPPIDARSDIYALACVLYECLTAKQPFPGDSLEQQVGNHLVSPPPRPSKTNPKLGRGFDPVIAKGMAKDPRDRYSTAVELARAASGAVTMPIPMPASRAPVRQPAAPPLIGAPPFAENFVGRPIPPPRRAGVDTVQRPVSGPNAHARPEPPAAPEDVRSPVTPPPAQPPEPARPWWRRRKVILSGTALLAVVAVVVTVMAGHRTHGSIHANPRQTALPFSGLRKPEGVTVDSRGTVYVADTVHNTILALPPGATKPVTLKFEVSSPTGVTTDNKGNIYVNDAGNKRVVVLLAGQTTQSVLNFPDLGHPTGLTVDRARTVYVTDTTNNKVWALPLGAAKAEPVEFSTGLNAPTGLTMGEDGTIYIADGGNNRVLALPRGSKIATKVNFEGLNDPGGVTVDSEGALYVTDSGGNRALKLPVGSTQQVVLPFTGLEYPWGLAVDSNGTVYVAGHNDKILVLPQK